MESSLSLVAAAPPARPPRRPSRRAAASRVAYDDKENRMPLEDSNKENCRPAEDRENRVSPDGKDKENRRPGNGSEARALPRVAAAETPSPLAQSPELPTHTPLRVARCSGSGVRSYRSSFAESSLSQRHPWSVEVRKTFIHCVGTSPAGSPASQPPSSAKRASPSSEPHDFRPDAQGQAQARALAEPQSEPRTHFDVRSAMPATPSTAGASPEYDAAAATAANALSTAAYEELQCPSSWCADFSSVGFAGDFVPAGSLSLYEQLPPPYGQAQQAYLPRLRLSDYLPSPPQRRPPIAGPSPPVAGGSSSRGSRPLRLSDLLPLPTSLSAGSGRLGVGGAPQETTKIVPRRLTFGSS